jgi:hypothetical protein
MKRMKANVCINISGIYFLFNSELLSAHFDITPTQHPLDLQGLMPAPPVNLQRKLVF